ncbi:MAG TPA: diadenylate cyclase [Terriglobia bacterium]|nr:diadenylate cyclase [Terriglobia bacterium]
MKAASGADLIARQYFIKLVSRIIDFDTASELFDLFNEIALLPYEEAANSGLLLLCRPDSHKDLLTLKFEAPFSLRDLRGVRKMLQVSDQELCLLCDGREVHGFKEVGNDVPDTLIVQFHPHGMWELKEGGAVVVQISAIPNAPLSGRLDEDCFTTAARTVFGELREEECHTLWGLISMAARQLRGTNVLISGQAAVEAERLASQCTRVKPTLLTPMLMERVTSIDGTVIIDTNGVCHAIGAILDGPAAERGDRTRGGRYNSAVMYVDGSAFPSIIVVVSQNGMIDLVCSPRLIGRT